MHDLATQHCTPGLTQALTAGAIAEHLALLPGWAVRDGALEKTYRFADFHRTMAFVNALAWVAHAEDHHPDLQLSYGHCTVRWSTHSAGGITHNDVVCAAQVERLLDGAGPP